MRRAPLVLLVAVPALLLGTACSKSSRDDARKEFQQQLVDDGGLDEDVAKCVTDRFFDARTDEELKEFFGRDELTEPESAEFARLGKECLAASSVSTT